MHRVWLSLALAGLASAQDLAPPVELEAAGQKIATEIGHAAPFVHDWDRDGKPDLLVGQFGGGKLAIYRADEAGLEAPTWFEGTIESG